MTRIANTFLSLALLCSTPALAQVAVPSQGETHAHRAGMHKCMVEHLPTLKAEVVEHMKEFRASHPTATRDEKHAERRAFSKVEKNTHGPEIQAARAACRSAV